MLKQHLDFTWLPIREEKRLKIVRSNINKHAIWALPLSLLDIIHPVTTFQQQQ